MLEQLGIGFVQSSPLDRSFLTGTIDGSTTLSDGDIRKNQARFADMLAGCVHGLLARALFADQRNDT